MRKGFHFEQAIVTLERFRQEFGPGALRGEAVNKSGYYRTEHWIKVVMVCRIIRDTRLLRDMMQHAIMSACPRKWSACLCALVRSAEYLVPRASTISHARFVFVMGLLVCRRSMFEDILRGDKPRPFDSLDELASGPIVPFKISELWLRIVKSPTWPNGP